MDPLRSSLSRDGTRVNLKKGDEQRRVTFGERQVEKRGCARIDPKIPNRKLQCRLRVGARILFDQFLMASGFFLYFIEGLCYRERVENELASPSFRIKPELKFNAEIKGTVSRDLRYEF